MVAVKGNESIHVQKTAFGYLVFHKHSTGLIEFLSIEQTYQKALTVVRKEREALSKQKVQTS